MANNYFRKSQSTIQKNKVHPIWSGIGCLLTILTPIMAWAASLVALEYGLKNGWSFVSQLSGDINFPAILYKIPVFNSALAYLSSIPYLEALIMFFLLFLLLFSGLFTVLNAILYRQFGPPRYSPVDAPPPTQKATKRSR